MQQTEQVTEWRELGQSWTEGIGAPFPDLSRPAETLAQVAHDARNMISALDLYCDLLQEPGVLTDPFSHYGSDLKLVAVASRSLVEKLASLGSHFGRTHELAPANDASGDALPIQRSKMQLLQQAQYIENFASELFANRNVLDAIAGPHIVLTIDVEGGEQPVRMTTENLTRILVNLVKNATEAMSSVGRINLSLVEGCCEAAGSLWLTLNIEDNGPGIADRLLGMIFEPGQTTHVDSSTTAPRNGSAATARGLGLSITRTIVEAAGGQIHAANRDPLGACFQIQLPVAPPAAGESKNQTQQV